MLIYVCEFLCVLSLLGSVIFNLLYITLIFSDVVFIIVVVCPYSCKGFNRDLAIR